MFTSARLKFTSLIQNTHMTTTHKIIGATVTLLIAFLIGIWSRPDTTTVTKANAQWAPEALSMVDSIKQSGAEWQDAQNRLKQAQAAMTGATLDVYRAEAAAKGADLTLCAKFQARYDRKSDALVPDANCPLL